MHHRVAKRKALSQTGDKAYTLRSSVTSRVPSPPSAVKDKTHGLTRKEKENPDVDACALVRRNTPQAELAANPLSCTRDNVRSTLGCWIKLGAKRRQCTICLQPQTCSHFHAQHQVVAPPCGKGLHHHRAQLLGQVWNQTQATYVCCTRGMQRIPGLSLVCNITLHSPLGWCTTAPRPGSNNTCRP